MTETLVWLGFGCAVTAWAMAIRHEHHGRWYEPPHDWWFLPGCVVFWPIVLIAIIAI